MSGDSEVNVTPAEAERFATRLFEQAGVAADVARVVAQGLVAAELEGHASHGLLQASTYIRRIRAGTMSTGSAPRRVHQSGPISVYDAGLALGHAAADTLTGVTIEEARRHGMSAVAVRSATHFGVAGRYARTIAERELVGIVMSNTRPMMPAPGGSFPVAGNNPLAIAVPCAGQAPVVFDMAMSAAAMGRIRQAAESGAEIPADWAVDAEGHETTDAARALEGMLLPAGGPKGFGLALMIDFLCALAGGTAGGEVGHMHGDPATPAECSWLFLALDPARFGLDTSYAARVAELAGAVRDRSPDPARALPGDRRLGPVGAMRDTIRLQRPVVEVLEAMSQELGGGNRLERAG